MRRRLFIDWMRGIACVLASMVALAHLIDPMRQLLARQRKVQLA